MHGERRDVGWLDHAPDRQGGAELVAARLQLIAEECRGQRRVDEAGRDEVDPDRGELEREVGGDGRDRGGGYRRDGQGRR